MEEESMEEEGGGEAMMDDQNHNNWGAGGYGRLLLGERPLPARPAGPEQNGAGLRGCEPGAAAGRAGAAGAIAAINISASTSKFLMNVITIEDYKSTYWPKLDSAIDQLLTQSPGDYIPISYEQIYSCVYKCVCQQHSEQMYSDLIKKITNHLERVSKELQASPPDLYIERFNVALGQYMGALQSIVPLFIYMNKFYIETKLNRDLKDDLIKLFTEHVAEKHIYNLMPLLLEAQSTPFQITPSTMANIVKGLYTLRPEWVQMAPALFSKFIPNILPPAVESELQEYAAQDQKLQRELIQNGFTRGDQSRKRAGEELTYSKYRSSPALPAWADRSCWNLDLRVGRCQRLHLHMEQLSAMSPLPCLEMIQTAWTWSRWGVISVLMAHQLVQAPGDTDSEYTGPASIPSQNRHWRSTGDIWSLLWQLLILKL